MSRLRGLNDENNTTKRQRPIERWIIQDRTINSEIHVVVCMRRLGWGLEMGATSEVISVWL